ncbi:hypothetical protein GRI55_14175 [Erythrobacter citreus]|uniref:Uncharacterized protein n=1 Tax=Qipengyuania citrea TaxID=225971 RepID=A0A6I4UGD2_9SPHN|nr:hypothetical protein [Qipengyuania citrea]MDQ0567350.1 hypothetical protein [Qipengyuania citrea]MXP36894.1 hypothetical protein [Qipengyuania citrea]
MHTTFAVSVFVSALVQVYSNEHLWSVHFDGAASALAPVQANWTPPFSAEQYWLGAVIGADYRRAASHDPSADNYIEQFRPMDALRS